MQISRQSHVVRGHEAGKSSSLSNCKKAEVPGVVGTEEMRSEGQAPLHL